MKKKIIPVPEGIRYLSQWKDLWESLPNDHFIFNKVHTGVGATQYFLTNNEKIILCSPRCSLMDSKRAKHPEVWFYRDMNDNADPDIDGKRKAKKKASYEDIQKYNADVVKYVAACQTEGKVPKIMVTYDSLGHVTDALKSINKNELSGWALVVDEFQVIFSDASFKSLTEMMFLENAKLFNTVIYLSATPYLETYMDEMDEFKNLQYIELAWPKEMEKKAVVTDIPIKKGESKYKVVGKIIDHMRKGKTVKFDTKEIDTTEAVFYINKVSDIIKIVQKNNLKPEEVNILCSKSSEDKLKKAGLTLGSIPKEGDPHKMFTFATKSVYLGVDFYSKCAFSYIFADPSQTTLALDIYVDLSQILGRQRLEENPYRNEAILFMKENSIGFDEQEFSEYIEKKKKATDALIENFKTNKQDPSVRDSLIQKFRTSMEHDRYKNDYLTVIDNKATGEAEVTFNTLYMLAEIRAWEIRKNHYSSTYHVIREQMKAGMNASVGTESISKEVLAFKEDFENTRVTDQRIRAYSDFRQQHPELADEMDFVSHKYAEYWDALGYDNLKALGFQESKIKAALANPAPDDPAIDKVIKEIRGKLKEGKRYALKKLKEVLNKIYRKVGYRKVAKAKDIEKYVTAKYRQNSKSSKREYEIQSLFKKDITLFPFVWKPNAPMNMTIDRFLEIIKTGNYKITSQKKTRTLKNIISEIRSTQSHDRQGELKREWLPVGCINGTFKYKDDRGLEHYSSFLALDYDKFKDKDDMDAAKEKLKTIPFIYAIFETPSGLGLKAIVMHDSTNPAFHWNLYLQIMEQCKLPQIDTGVTDLSRGQFLSYDPNLWRNDQPEPFIFEFNPKLQAPSKKAEKYVSTKGTTGNANQTRLDSWVENFLHELGNSILTDDAIMRRLDNYWKKNKQKYFEAGKRHNGMLVIAGTLCKAGIPRDMTLDYLKSSYQGMKEDEIRSVMEYAYEHNPFGCDRRRYKK